MLNVLIVYIIRWAFQVRGAPRFLAINTGNALCIYIFTTLLIAKLSRITIVR